MSKRREQDQLEELDRWLRKHSLRSRLTMGRRKYALVGLPVAAVAVALLLFNAATPGGLVPKPVPIGRPTSDFIGGTIVQGPLQFQPTQNQCTGDYRYDYGLNCTSQKFIFGNLPFFHADTYSVANHTYQSFLTGGTWDISSVTSDYWLQPEFYPSWREDIPGKMLTPGPYHTPQGFGMYPWIRAWTVPACSAAAQGQQSLDGTFLLHAGWGVDNWQGFGMYAFFPDAAINLNGTVHFSQDPAYAAQHVNLTVTAAEDDYYTGTLAKNKSFQPVSYPSNAIPGSGRAIVLGPTDNLVFPGFHKDWAQTVVLSVRLAGVQPGDRFVIDLYGADMNSWLGDRYYVRYGDYFNTDGTLYGGPWAQYIFEVVAC